MSLLVNEIFYSIQGESTFFGLPCVFVRLTGCNLRCRYCDTQYAYEEGRLLSVDEILRQVKSHGCNLVEITGGEPLLQTEVPELAEKFAKEHMKVLLETNGTQDISRTSEGVIRIMDIKCPSSGEADKTDWQNIDRLNTNDEVKFVLADREDFDWACKVIDKHHLLDKTTVLISPVYGKLQPAQLAEWVIEKKMPVRLQLQMHKIIWGNKRGV